jgi:hypothetical protein
MKCHSDQKGHRLRPILADAITGVRAAATATARAHEAQRGGQAHPCRRVGAGASPRGEGTRELTEQWARHARRGWQPRMADHGRKRPRAPPHDAAFLISHPPAAPPSFLPPVRPQRCQLAGPKPRRTPAHGPQIKNPDKGPSLRTGHSLCVVGLPNNPKAVIIGGCTADGVVNEVWNLKLGVEMLEWESPNIGQPDKAPAPRWRHTATLLRTLRPPPPSSSSALLAGRCSVQLLSAGHHG